MKSIVEILLWCCAVLPYSVVALSAPDWLYSVQRPVETQSKEERNRVAQDALLAVLTRMTGLVSVPRTETIKAALANPSRYYSEYDFFTDGSENLLRITFQRPAVMALIRRSRLPVWWSLRPEVLIWIVIEENGRREIIGSQSTHPLRAEIAKRAKVRGLEVQFPHLDVDDSWKISAAEVWGNVSSSLEQASRRYESDLVLTCRLNARLSLAGRTLDGDCRFWLDESPVVSAFSSDQFVDVAMASIDAAADRLVARYGVLARSLKRWQVRIRGLRDVTEYAELLSYVDNLDFVDSVALSRLESEQITLLFDTRAEAEQLLMLLTAEGKFVVDNFDAEPGVQLIWQG